MRIAGEKIDGLYGLHPGDRFEQALVPWRGQRLPAPLDGELALVITGAAERVARALGAVRKSSAGGDDTGRHEPVIRPAAFRLADSRWRKQAVAYVCA